MRKYVILILALGVAVCLIGALVMVAGESILGENHTGIATIIGIVGIGIIGTFAAIFAATSSKRSSKEAKSSTGGV